MPPASSLSFWWRPLLFVLSLGLAALALAIGWSSNRGWMLFSAGLLIYLIYHLQQLARLTARLSNEGERPIQPGDGLWGDVYYRMENILLSRQDMQQKIAADLEQMLEATRSLPDGMVILEQDNRIVWLNDAATRLLGLSPKRDIGQFVLYLLRNSHFSEWLGAGNHRDPLTMESPTLREHSLSMQVISLPRQQKMLLARDITDLVRVDAMRRDFVANVSHELRTPITVILGFLEAFEDMPDAQPGEFQKHIPLMREQSERIRSLVDDLLALAKLESEPDTRDETVDVLALARRLIDEAESLSQGRLQISLSLESRARLIGNGQELYSALANLVTNAVRYTPQGGRIGIHWRMAENGSATFTVTDTGEGIEAQHIPRLTERFYRVDRGRSRATGGTGLGLAIVKHVLQRHQARLKIESTLGKGSSFSAQFPNERVIPEP